MQKAFGDFQHLLPQLIPHRRVLTAILCLLLAGSVVSLAGPWLAGLFTASILGELNIQPGLLLGSWLALMTIRSLLRFLTTYRIGSTGQQLTANLRNRLYQHMQALPVGYYQQRSPGETLTLLSTDAAIISNFVTDTLVRLLPALLTFIGAFLLMAWLDGTIALVSILFIPVYVVAVKLLGRQLRPLSRAWVDANSDMVSLAQENLAMLPTIKAFTREDHEQQRFEAAISSLLRTSQQQLRVQAILSPVISLLGGIGLIALLWVGSAHIQSGRLEPAEMVSLLLYAMLLVTPLRTLADVYGQVQRTRGSAERIAEFLRLQPEPADEGTIILKAVKGRIRFEGVSFAYPGRDLAVRDIDLGIQAGETAAITGPNGAGKSTLAHLLMRFADTDKGRILIDGTDIREVTLASLRANIGLVAQQVLLLNGSVAENIAYGEPEADSAAVERAARAACAHEFIKGLPEGYNTVIGDQGVRLSGGQRQRISLARTLLKDPPILILDEATAMFDPAGEKEFIEGCRELLNQKTVIFITHRSTNLALADIVFHLDKGGVFSE
jgi:ABC-type multidrug transport system fused ATPase/permease subunit